ncbi:hypothetical protein MMC16_004148 [Acarospora aff. strigata]|nr:hypothetical protein [Acarospora aff. strigata]
MSYIQPLNTYQTCDSYFVEPERYDVVAARAEEKERAKFIARERQIAIGEELSYLAKEEYQDDILSHMEQMEVKHPGPDFIPHLANFAQVETVPDVASIDIQTEIQWFMRPYLLDFLIEAHTAFRLLPETLFLTVNLLDRYCSKRVVYKRHYQLVGCSALLIAAKYGDRKDRVPTIKELKSMCCSLYEDDMFTQMEWHVLQTLGWVVGHPTIDAFLQVALADIFPDPEVEHMAWYISEIAMFHKDFVSKRSSDMARSALALARCILDRPQPLHCEWAADYDCQTLVTLSQQLHRPSQVLSRKYSSVHLSRVSATLEEFLARQASIARCYAAPPTPPREVPPSNGPAAIGSVSHYTPPKGQYLGTAPNGYMTPPITPDGDYAAYAQQKAFGAVPPQPATPTPYRGQQSRFAYAYQQMPLM